MNLYLLLFINIVIIGFACFFILDSSQEFTTYKTQSLCLKTKNNQKLCAECYRRDPDLLRSKAFKIQSSEVISILKIKEQQNYLSCYDYLQLVNPQKDSNSQKEINFQAIPVINQVIKEIAAQLQTKMESGLIVQPWFSQFVIYKWGETGDIKVMYPNPENFRTINFYFLYGFNFLLLVILVAWIADTTFLKEQTTPVKLCLASIVVLLQLYFLDINSEICLYLCRILVLNLGLFRLKVNNFKVLSFLIVGIIVTYSQVTLPFYVVATIVLIFYYGKSQPDSTEIQRYLTTLYVFFLLNHLYLYQFTQYLNDSRNLVIDLCLILMIPLGMFLVTNQKKFRPYRPVDPEIRSISLSGYDQEEPTNI